LIAVLQMKHSVRLFTVPLAAGKFNTVVILFKMLSNVTHFSNLKVNGIRNLVKRTTSGDEMFGHHDHK